MVVTDIITTPWCKVPSVKKLSKAVVAMADGNCLSSWEGGSHNQKTCQKPFHFGYTRTWLLEYYDFLDWRRLPRKYRTSIKTGWLHSPFINGNFSSWAFTLFFTLRNCNLGCTGLENDSAGPVQPQATRDGTGHKVYLA